VVQTDNFSHDIIYAQTKVIFMQTVKLFQAFIWLHIQ